MTEDLIAMAREIYGTEATEQEIRFAALIEARAVARTREECAQKCDDMVLYTGFDCAEAIRALGERT